MRMPKQTLALHFRILRKLNEHERGYMKLNKHPLWVFFFTWAIILAGLITAGCSRESASTSRPRNNSVTPSVEAIQARSGSLPLVERLNGVVRAKNQVDIYSPISALIMRVEVRNGDYVEAGQPLVFLRDNEFQERLKQAQANLQISIAQARQAEAELKEAENDLNRTQTLAEQDLSSAVDLESRQTAVIAAEADLALARARVEQAQATVEERREALSETIVRAPVAGTVGNRQAEIGMLVSPNNRLFTLGQLDNITIEIVLTDVMLTYIEEGQRSQISAPNLFPDGLPAPLSRISPFLHPITHSTDAEIELINPGQTLKPGMFVTVDIYYGESEQATLVPLSALYEHPGTGITGVYISQEPIAGEAAGQSKADQGITLTNPVSFDFVPVDVVAKGRMGVGLRGIEPGDWVISLGQNLLGGESGQARVHVVDWEWVTNLQSLQREDLLKEIMDRQQKVLTDTAGFHH